MGQETIWFLLPRHCSLEGSRRCCSGSSNDDDGDARLGEVISQIDQLIIPVSLCAPAGARFRRPEEKLSLLLSRLETIMPRN